MTPSPEAKVTRWTPASGPPRRLVFEPVGDEYELIEQVWSGCGYWREVGSEIVTDVVVGQPMAAVESQTGP